MIRFTIALVIGGAVLTYFGYSEHQLASAAQAQPQSLSVADLIAKGPGENMHVVLTDLYVLNDYAYETTEDRPNNFDKLWVPAIDVGDPWVGKVQALASEAEQRNPDNPDYTALVELPYPDNIKLVVYSKEINSEADFDRFWESDQVQGLLVNQVEDLSGDELKNLKSAYPSLDPAEVYILEHNRSPKSTTITMLMMVGGILLILAGPGLFFFSRRK